MKRFAKLLQLLLIAALLGGLLPLPAWTTPARAEAGRPSLDVTKTLNAPAIDGKLDDSVWRIDQPLPVRVGDGTFQDSRFGLLWDNTYLYIGVKADDDNLIDSASGYWFEQDNINIFLDPTMHQSQPFASDDMQLGFVYKPGTATPEFHFGAALNNHSGKDEKKILRAIGKTDSGWALEVAVPWSMLNFDPVKTKQLGINISATDRYGTDTTQQHTSYWSAYNSSSFWNDTTGYGTIALSESNPATGAVNPVLLDENFDGVPAGQIPFGWISDVNAGSPPFSVVQDTYGNGRIVFNGNVTGQQSRVTAPVQWDNYTIEADVRFEAVVNNGRWASLMFRGAANGKNPYNQMAIRQNGTYEIAYRKPDNNWTVPVSGVWPQQLALNADYRMKVRVFDNNVKEYIKAATAADYTLLTDKSLGADVLLERGKIGLQADQSKVSFDNLKVTRITADRLDLTMPATVEALTGPTNVTAAVYFSDGITEPVAADRIKLYSSDESIIKIANNKVYPIKAGSATIKAVYANAEATQQVTVTPSTTGPKVVSLKHSDGYILAVAGATIDLDAVSFQADWSDYTTGPVKGSQLSWTSSDTGVVIAGGTLQTVQQKGIYTVTGQKDGVAVPLLLVAKNADDSDYVLYEENFDAVPNGSLPQGWTRKEGTTASKAAVQAGAFVMDASAAPDNPSRVLLPSYLALFGNYKIEADVTHLAANDAARWHSIMYRVQNNDYPYLQMAVRKDATAANGVEFAERTPANAWNVIDKGAYTEAIDAAKMYHYKVETYGNRVQESIGSKIVVNTDLATSYAKGGIGLQSNGSIMKVDNVKVTLQQNPLPPMPPTPAERFVSVAAPDTKIAIAPTVAADINALADLTGLAGNALPATVMLHLNSDLNVTDRTGQTPIGTLASVLDTVANRMIPAFYVKDAQTVDKLVAYLTEQSIEDAFVISDNGDLVKRARTAYPIVRGIVDFSATADNVTQEQLLEMRSITTTSLAKIALLPQSAATKDNVDYLQHRAIVVWTKDTSGSADKRLAMHTMITAGTNGIVTDTPATALDAFKVYANRTTLIRKPYMISHRGLPALAPENTLESNALAIDAGGDFIENDMVLSKDGVAVIVHDDTLERTTNGTGRVEDYTLAQLKALNANKPHPEGFPDVKIPTWDEQIDLVLSRGKMLEAEIKSGNPATVPAVVQSIRDKHAEAAVNIMSFYPDQLTRFSQLMPEVPTGLLIGSVVNDANAKKSLREALLAVKSNNATYNVGYYGLGKNFLEAANHRGLLVSPWTINDRNDFINMFLLGVWGITTDYTHYASDWAAAIKPAQINYDLTAGQTTALSANIETYKGATSAVAPEVVVLDGQNAVEVTGSSITAKSPGTAHVLLRYTFSIDATNKYDLYTQPVTLKVGGVDPSPSPSPSPTPTPTPTPDPTPSPTPSSTPDPTPSANPSPEPSPSVKPSPSASPTPSASVSPTPSSNPTPTPSSTPGPKPSSKPGNGNPGQDPIQAVDGKLGASELKDALAATEQAQVQFNGNNLELSAAGLTDAARNSGASVAASNENGTYVLPLSALQLDALAQQLGTNVNELSIVVKINKRSGNDAAPVEEAASQTGSRQIADTIDFEVSAVGIDGKTVTISFGSTYVSRSLTIDSAVDPDKATGVWYDPATNKLRFVPTVFETRNGVTTATLKRTGNSVYTVVENDRRFADMAGHWAQADVELLANKLVVDGVDNDRFDGDRRINRAEFAALLVRSLGLSPATTATTYADVAASAWYAGDVAAATAAGLIDGYDDGTFRPLREITREEQAAMIVRALTYAGVDTTVPTGQQDAVLKPFRDAGSITWAKADIAAAVNSGLMNGMTADTLEPNGYATRAQAAVMIKRFLGKANFIN